jgi:hypothetical protein
MHIQNTLKDMALCLQMTLQQAMHSKQVDTLPIIVRSERYACQYLPAVSKVPGILCC